jgi:pyruvate dehydrogenase E2 component (dihydrolipoamide acetyltransferase)
MAKKVSVVVPDLGDFKDVNVIELLVKPGDVVAVDTPLITLETEKATMDVPSTAAGQVVEVTVRKGDTVSKGDEVLVLQTSERAPATPEPVAPLPSAAVPAREDTALPPAPAPAATAALPPPSVAIAASAASPSMARVETPSGTRPPVEEAGFSRAHASPSVRRFARELGVDLARVKGSATKGRITHDDVKAFVKASMAQAIAPTTAPAAALPATPVVDFAAFGPVEVRPLGRIRKISASRLHASWVNLPHVTQFDEADITELEATRERLKPEAAAKGLKLTPLAFILRAVAVVLARFPQFNTSLDAGGQNLVFKQYVHLGFAADTPNGLMVPVIRDADRKDIYELARALAELSEKSRLGKLAAVEMQGGTFTVSSLGGIGGTAFTPIINAPEVAILGVSKSQTKPVWTDGQFLPRLVLPLSLSYDHRVIDGAAAARFTSVLAQTLAQPQALVEAVP